jgi:hypothetical protein
MGGRQVGWLVGRTIKVHGSRGSRAGEVEVRRGRHNRGRSLTAAAAPSPTAPCYMRRPQLSFRKHTRRGANREEDEGAHLLQDGQHLVRETALRLGAGALHKCHHLGWGGQVGGAGVRFGGGWGLRAAVRSAQRQPAMQI